MGGNALTLVETRRVNRDEYEQITEQVRSLILGYLSMKDNRVRVTDLPAYRAKTDFGDLDLLVETFEDQEHVDYKKMIIELFSPQQIVQNSGAYSFDFKSFQIDLILTPTEDFDTSYSYYSWNDLGNLAGRIYKKLGFKYGHRGLSYIFREDDKSHTAYSEVIVSKDIKRILEFGDLNYERFQEGFDTLDDMFIWVSSSKYFHKDIYLLHNRNHTSRIRDRKRKVYNLFLKWCEETEGLNAYPWTQMREQDGYAGKPEFLRLALKAFPGFDIIHCEVLSKHENDKRVKTKFNGHVVSKLTNLEGKELGHFMSYIIEQRGGRQKCWEHFLHATNDSIEKIIGEEHAKYISSQ